MTTPDRGVPKGCSGLFRHFGTACSVNADLAHAEFRNTADFCRFSGVAMRNTADHRGHQAEQQEIRAVPAEKWGVPKFLAPYRAEHKEIRSVPVFPLRGDVLCGTALLPRGLAALQGGGP